MNITDAGVMPAPGLDDFGALSKHLREASRRRRMACSPLTKSESMA